MTNLELKTRDIGDQFCVLSKYVQEAADRCGSLQRYLKEDVKIKREHNLRE